MKIGPARNSKSPSRWFQIDEPVTSAGSRSGVNWTRLKPSPLASAKERAVSVFASPGTSSSRTWPSASRPSRISSSCSRLPTTARSTSSTRRAPSSASSRSSIRSRSSAVTTRPSSASSIPEPWRSVGCGRSGRTSSQTSSPSAACARSGSRSRSMPRREDSSSAASSVTDGAEAKVDVERRRARHRHLALEPAQRAAGARQTAASAAGGSPSNGDGVRG